MREKRLPLNPRRWLENDHGAASIAKGASKVFLLKGLAALAGFLFNIALARSLGVDGAGIYFQSLAIVTIASVVARFGLDNAVLKHVSVFFARNEWAKIINLMWTSATIILICATIVLVALFYANSLSLAEALFGESALSGPLQVMLLAVFPYALALVVAEALKALNKVNQGVVIQSLLIPTLSIPLLLLSAPSHGIAGASAAFVGASAITCLIGLVLLVRALPRRTDNSDSQDKLGTKTLLQTSWPLFGVTLMNFVMVWASVIIVGIYEDSKMVGLYGAAVRLAGLVQFFILAVNSIVAPRFARYFASGDMVGLAIIARRACTVTTLGAAPLLLLLLIMPALPLLFFGRDFVEAAPLLQILALAQFVNVATGSVGYLLMMCGHERTMRSIIFVSAIVNVLLNFLLITRYGVIGAAWASGISLALMNLASLYFVLKFMGILALPIGPSLRKPHQ